MITIAGCLIAQLAWALQPVPYVMRQLSLLHGEMLHYDYKMRLLDIATGYAADSIQGTLYKRGRYYLDSSNAAYTCLGEKFYTKIEHRSRTALVYDLNVLEARLGRSLEQLSPAGVQITDSLPMVIGSLQIDSTRPGWFRVSWDVRSMQPVHLQLWVRKSDYRVTQVDIDQGLYEGSKLRFRVQYSIFNIRHEVPPGSIDPTRAFSVRGTSVVLSAPYTDYSLSTLTK